MKLSRLLFFALLALIPAMLLTRVWRINENEGLLSLDEVGGGALAIEAEWLMRTAMPFRDTLITLNDRLKMAGGSREVFPRVPGYPVKQNGIFVGGGSLMRNIEPPVQRYVDMNIEAIAEFAEIMRQSRKQSYLMLVPTSGAVMQQKLPPYADSVMVNQLGFIEDVYRRISGAATTIDAYSALLARQGQYIYYRTENNITALGGYYVYAAMLPRMGLGRADFNQFDIDYMEGEFYGDLYGETGYAGVAPDLISMFRRTGARAANGGFLVTHTDGGSVKSYHTLFPGHAAVLGRQLDIFMGGLSFITDISTASQHTGKILIFGDKTALGYMPFLANSCERVTLVDLSASRSDFSGIDAMDYDKIVFAYGVESFMHTSYPSRVTALLAS